jgi:Cd2+/Zn2+-exporting ATPase
MAAALVDHARSLAIEPKPEHVVEFHNFPGEGIHGKVDGNDIYIGNRKIALRAGCATGESHHLLYPESYVLKHPSFTIVL